MNFLSFVGEMVMSPKYEGYFGGRIEVYPADSNSPYATEEIKYFTPRKDEFLSFRDKYDFEEVDDKTLDKIRKTVAERFYNEIA